MYPNLILKNTKVNKVDHFTFKIFVLSSISFDNCFCHVSLSLVKEFLLKQNSLNRTCDNAISSFGFFYFALVNKKQWLHKLYRFRKNCYKTFSSIFLSHLYEQFCAHNQICFHVSIYISKMKQIHYLYTLSTKYKGVIFFLSKNRYSFDILLLCARKILLNLSLLKFNFL